eukprot:TRINITY_DN75693_c0_g1_i1.p1 TRINITY_DN75693_c0_g1~~TRINITY_DN75693_c0_g1_i1.p1  ORF type:complete len:390 (+),score=38.93 TRINITY_DN75693_c0_g1_i1:37-1170(+)
MPQRLMGWCPTRASRSSMSLHEMLWSLLEALVNGTLFASDDAVPPQFLRGPALVCLLSYLEASDQQRLVSCFRIRRNDTHLLEFGRLVRRDYFWVFQSWMVVYFLEFGRRVGKSLSAFTWQDRIVLKRFMVDYGYGAAAPSSQTGEPLICHAVQQHAHEAVRALLKSADHQPTSLSAMSKVALVVRAARGGNRDTLCTILPFLDLPTLLMEELPDIVYEFSPQGDGELKYFDVAIRLRTTRLIHWILFAGCSDLAGRVIRCSSLDTKIGCLYKHIDIDAFKLALQKLISLGMVLEVPLLAEVRLKSRIERRETVVWQQRVTPLDFVNLFFVESANCISNNLNHLPQAKEDFVKKAIRSFSCPIDGLRRLASALQELL